MKKNTKKYAYVVDATEISVLEDVDVVFALAKQDAGLAITDDELMDIVWFAVKNNVAVKTLQFIPVIKEIFDNLPKIVEKANNPWYKRIWNTITAPVRKIWNMIKRKK